MELWSIESERYNQKQSTSWGNYDFKVFFPQDMFQNDNIKMTVLCADTVMTIIQLNSRKMQKNSLLKIDLILKVVVAAVVVLRLSLMALVQMALPMGIVLICC